MDKVPTHEFNERGGHRLVLNNKTSEWASYQGIAQLGEYYATTDYYNGALPELFKVTVIKDHQP
jgi:hypothetical protein